MERSESPEVEVEQKEDGSFVTHSHLSIKATSIELLHDHHSWQHYNHHHYYFNSTPLQAGAGPDLEAVCYATNEVLGADSVTTCLHKKDIKSDTNRSKTSFEKVALVHNVVIISPPGVPTISGVQPHSSVQV